jgi:hypothetical protein
LVVVAASSLLPCSSAAFVDGGVSYYYETVVECTKRKETLLVVKAKSPEVSPAEGIPNTFSRWRNPK